MKVSGIFNLRNLNLQRCGRAGLAILFCITGIAHFTHTDQMIQFLPPWVPARPQIIYVTGIMELAFAAGLLIDRTARATGIVVILFLISVFPANIYGAIQRVDLAGHGAGPGFLWIRAPLQFVLIIWTYYFAVMRRPSHEM